MAGTVTVTTPAPPEMTAGISPLDRLAALVSLGLATLWSGLFLRWLTFSAIDWQPLALELALAQWPPLLAYALYGVLFVADLLIALGLLRGVRAVRPVALARAAVGLVAGLLYFSLVGDFYGAALLLFFSGLVLLLMLRQTAWAVAYPAATYLLLFFVIPLVIVFVVSLGERTRLGTVTYPPFSWDNLGVYFNDYVRFFSPVNGEYIYLRILLRSAGIAILNTILCLLIGYPFSYWIARQPERYRPGLVFLVMIPFWTNFLVRTYAWMLILRDSGIINNFWTITLHEQAVMLSGNSQFFAWLADITSDKLPLLFNQPAVVLGLLYGYLPFMVLPLYTALEKFDWTLLEAAADLGAGRWASTLRILIPLSMPGIVAGSIIVFIPSLGAYVTPDLMGGARVALVGNLLQQQFMTVRNWPFGSAIGFILMTIMLAATIIYFRSSTEEQIP